MSVNSGVSERRSVKGTNASDINPVQTVAEAFYSLLAAVDSESIADEFRICIHSTTHNFDNYLEIGIFKRVDPSDSLAELAEKTATSEQMTCMGNSTFTRLTNDREETVSWTTFPRLHCPTVGSGVTYERLTKSF